MKYLKKEKQTNSIVFQKYCTSVSFKQTCQLFYKTNKMGTLLKKIWKIEIVSSRGTEHTFL